MPPNPPLAGSRRERVRGFRFRRMIEEGPE